MGVASLSVGWTLRRFGCSLRGPSPAVRALPVLGNGQQASTASKDSVGTVRVSGRGVDGHGKAHEQCQTGTLTVRRVVHRPGCSTARVKTTSVHKVNRETQRGPTRDKMAVRLLMLGIGARIGMLLGWHIPTWMSKTHE
uniref:(northern house mosquito) hypothetical protein n=1 Tax=Culex pipiens TaxID=7175 RepID=A0A8D8AX95_CULPI